MMQALELDLHAARARSPWPGRVLFAVALAFAAQVSVSYSNLQDSVHSAEAQLAHEAGSADSARRAPASAASPEELRAARETIARLSLSWDELFGALESSAATDVALLSIEPDSRGGTVLVTGEAQDFAAALRYVGRLDTAKSLRGAHLVKHELRQGDARRPLVFTASARWKESR
jgi:hypothetical protein